MMRSALITLAVAVTCGSAVAQADSESVRGITLSTHGGGRDWGTDEIIPTLRGIRDVGSNWVATHPYSGIRTDGTVRVWKLDSDDPPEYLVRPIREAHALGLKIMIKPHLAYWGTPFSWRGEIEFDSAEKWERFWTGYRHWIVTLARMCSDADAFVVGTELDRTIEYEAEWRRIIAEVRAVTKAPLTYAANWTDYEKVPFWDALDAIGVQAYFPLVEQRDPSEKMLERAWAERMKMLHSFSEEQNRKIVFTELGYNRSHWAPVQPWESRDDGEEALPMQLTCVRVALRAVEREPRVVGVFLWKWFTWPNTTGRNFRLDTPEMRRVIRGVWDDSRGH